MMIWVLVVKLMRNKVLVGGGVLAGGGGFRRFGSGSEHRSFQLRSGICFKRIARV